MVTLFKLKHIVCHARLSSVKATGESSRRPRVTHKRMRARKGNEVLCSYRARFEPAPRLIIRRPPSWSSCAAGGSSAPEVGDLFIGLPSPSIYVGAVSRLPSFMLK